MLIDIPFVPFVCLEFLHVLVRLLLRFAALLLNDFSERGVHVLGHATGIAADEEMSTLAIEPFPNLSSVLQHFVLDIRFTGLIARPGTIEVC